ncbi:hypothetical protein D3C86_2033570 [compost metagenome]
MITELRQKISKQLDELTLAMRAELELSSEAEVFHAITAKTHEDIAGLLAEVRSAMRGLQAEDSR